MPEDKRVIKLRVSNYKAFLWDVDDIAYIRSQHHICGVLTGTLPHVSQQNVFLGIPLVLMPEEVVLLVEIGAAIIVDDPHAHLQPTIPQLEQWTLEQHALIEKQISIAETRSVKDTDKSMSEAAVNKRKAREEKRRVALLAAGGDVEDVTSLLASASIEKLKTQLPTIQGPSQTQPEDKFATALYTVVVEAPSDNLGWYDPSTHFYSTIEAAKEAGIWNYPSTLEERARCGVFKDLWEQGFYMGIGIKFGGEYLVYPGDPLRYHSHFTASVIESGEARIRPMEIVAHGRLGTATKKSHLLCKWDDEKKSVSYLSIEWAGFG